MLETVVVEGREYTILKTAAEKTHYKPTHLRQLAKTGKVEAIQLGQSWFVDLHSVATYKAAKPQRKPRAELGRRRKV